MKESALARSATSQSVEHFDVVIIGAGISGLGAACHLTRQCPDTRFVILDNQERFGGTWCTHRFPGTRSDSDLYTYGYRFKPWVGQPIATAPQILAYLEEVVEEYGLASHIRYRHRIVKARWSSQDTRWRLIAVRTDSEERVEVTAGFLWMCQGYYDHSQGYAPAWPGMADFAGRIVHPQLWPDDLNYVGKNIVVIGSGATAATIVPAMAADCAHVTMLQRSPTYFFSGSNTVPLADELRRLDVKEEWIYEIARRKFLYEDAEFMRRIRAEPDAVARELINGVRAHLGPDYDVETHFTPKYRPWAASRFHP